MYANNFLSLVYVSVQHVLEQMKARVDDAGSLTLLRQLRFLESELMDNSGSSSADTHASNIDVEELLLTSVAVGYTAVPADLT